VSLTREGVRLAAQVRAPFDDLRGVFEKRGTRDRAVKVTAAPTFGKRWLPPRIPRFLALYPDVTIEIEASVDLRSIEGASSTWACVAATAMARTHRARARAGVPRADVVAVACKVARRNLVRRGPAACAAVVGGGVAGLVQGRRHLRLVESARRLRMSFETQDVLADVAQTGVGVALLSPFIFRTRSRRSASSARSGRRSRAREFLRRVRPVATRLRAGPLHRMAARDGRR
jgi:DNA-binding transcriptional LysR family regulator